MNLLTLKKTLGTALLSLVALNGMAQDKIARQAPEDYKLKILNEVKINNNLNTIDLENPAADIYSDWSYDNVWHAPGIMPHGYKVDLRSFCMPTPSRRVTSRYGRRWRRQHRGTDLKVYTGDTIYAAFDGKVRITKYNRGGWGYYVLLRHPNGLETLYGHLSKQLVKEDDIVKAGQPIGLGGNTGRSTGSHLHFEVHFLGQAINPEIMFDFANQDIKGDYYDVTAKKVTNNGPTNTGITIARESVKPEVATDNTNVVAKKTTTVSTATAKKAVKKTTAKTYKIRKGDTLSGIAAKQGISVKKLCNLNGLNTNSVLRVGRVLKCS